MINEMAKSTLLSEGARFGPRDGQEVVIGFATDPAGYRAAKSATAVAPLFQRGWISLSGADRATFLHGQCTQQVKQKVKGQGGYALVLDQKGRSQTDIRFLVDEDRLLVEVDRTRVASLLTWFDRFIIADDVTPRDEQETLASLLVLGPKMASLLASLRLPSPPPEPDDFAAGSALSERVLVVHDPEYGVPAARLVASPRGVLHLWQRLREGGAAPLGFDHLDALRIEAMTPAYGRELDDGILPVESGCLARIANFEKGCYIGQEVVAMQYFRGKARRMVRAVSVLDEGVARGDGITSESGIKGRLTSVSSLAEGGERRAMAVLEGHEHPVGTPFWVQTSDGRRVAGRVLR